MISEQSLMFSNSVQNTVEYYGNVLLLIILKGTLSHVIYGPYSKQYICVSLNYQPPLNSYISICSQCASHIAEYSSCFLSVFATNISFPIHLPFKSPFPSHFSTHTLCSGFDQSFHNSVAFRNQLFNLFSPVLSRINYLFMYSITICNTSPISNSPRSCHVRAELISLQNDLGPHHERRNG
jgi:hypothetical protein